MANSIGASGQMLSGEKTVTTAGTAEALEATFRTAKRITIRAKVANTGQVYIGGADVASTTNDGLDANDVLDLESDSGLDMSDIYVDVDTDGEGVDFYVTK